MAKTSHPARGLLALALAGALVLAGAMAWARLGWRSMDITLEDRSGDAGQLRGFTLQGVLHWSQGADCLTFDLHDGYLDTRYFSDSSPWWTTTAAGHLSIPEYVVRPQDRIKVNANACEEVTPGDPTVFIFSAAETLRRMYTLPLPDGTYLRVTGADLAADEPSTVVYIPGESSNPRLNPQSSDYVLWATPGTSPFTQQSPTAKNPVPLGGGWALCWKRQEGDRAPGLYRATGLTPEEIAALPADGEAYGQKVLCNSTEFGTLEPFYCPADAEVALAGASMADDTILLLYLDEDGTVWADLVDEAGTRTDRWEVTTLPPDCEDYQAALLARTTDRDAVFTLESVPDADYWDKTISPRLAALRVEDGKFTVVASLADDPACPAEAAALNAEGDALLIASGDNYDGIPSETGLEVLQGLNLRVALLDGSATPYQGRLALGGERDWGQLVNAFSPRKQRVVDFPTIEKDRG